MYGNTRKQQVIDIISSYHSYPSPFSQHVVSRLKLNHPKAGSRDRKNIKELCYKSLRAKIFFTELEWEQIISFIVDHQEYEGLELIKSLEQEFQTQSKFNFPAKKSISKLINIKGLEESYAKSGKIWIKLEEEYKNLVIQELNENQIIFQDHNPHFLSVDLESKLTQLSSFAKGYFRIQDINSDATIDLIHSTSLDKIWDVCAGAGGKSLSILDRFPNAYIYATDSRNLSDEYYSRLAKKKAKPITYQVGDINKSNFFKNQKFELVLIDAPCSGSGTWQNNPANVLFFDKKEIEHYTNKQTQILETAKNNVQDNGMILYITCSVYSDENEAIMDQFIANNKEFKIEKSAYFEGHRMGAETIFATLIKKT